MLASGEATTTSIPVSLSSDESRSRRLIRSIARASRRYHILERLGRRQQPSANGSVHQVNGNGNPATSNGNSNGVRVIGAQNGHDNINVVHDVNKNGASAKNGAFQPSWSHGASNGRSENIYQEIVSPIVTPRRGKLFTTSSQKAKMLEAHNQKQMQQLNSLRNSFFI